MKIALVAEDFGCGSYVGGIARYTRTIAEAMARRGHSVTIVGSGQEPDVPAGVRYVRVPRWAAVGWLSRKLYYRMVRPLLPGWAFSLEWGLPLARELRRMARRGEIDIVEGPETGGFLLPAQALVRRGVPIVVRMHAPSAVTARDARADDRRHLRQLAAVEAASMRRAAAMTAPSRAVVSLAREAVVGLRANPVIVPNPAPPPRESHAEEAAHASEQVLFVGRLEPLKGYDVLVRAFGTVVCRRPTARLVMVGPDSLGVMAGGMRAFLETLLPREVAKSVEQRAEWLGAMPPGEIERLRAGAACVVVPSRYENLPYALLEPMSQGCPVIASDCGGISEVLGGTGAGVLVPPGDALALAEAVLDLLGDADKSRRIGTAARRLIESHYSPDAVAEMTVGMYEHVLGASAAGDLRAAVAGGTP